MKAIMVMYDSLNRHFLPNYGCELTKMPNFRRLGERTVTFDQSYVGSLPCMPARRELHTGRLNFLHRGWCPLEPFDDSMPELLKKSGVYTHLVSDHQHYWEDGGATYHTRYQTWECSRGQEGDPWKASLEKTRHPGSFGPEPKDGVGANMRRQDCINRKYMLEEADFPQAKTFAGGLEFIKQNKDYDNWFLQIETFDPHEPFFSPEEYQQLYEEEGDKLTELDWPPYGPVTEPDEVVNGVRNKYKALLSMCDSYLGKVLDQMDEFNLWKDTMLIVNTDHGFMLGEHCWWAKGVMPLYNEMAHTPLFIWDPRCSKKGERRKALVQNIDLAPTILDYFGLPIPEDMQGKPLKDTILRDSKVHDTILYGIFGSMINITDGRFVYMRAPAKKENQPLMEYTLMPTMMRCRYPVEQLAKATLASPFTFTKKSPVLAVPAKEEWGGLAACYRYGDVLYDLSEDPGQENPLDFPAKEVELINAMICLMKNNDAPPEQFERMGLPGVPVMTEELLLHQRQAKKQYDPTEGMAEFEWEEKEKWQFAALLSIGAPFQKEEDIKNRFRKERSQTEGKITSRELFHFLRKIVPEEDYEGAAFTLEMAGRLR